MCQLQARGVAATARGSPLACPRVPSRVLPLALAPQSRFLFTVPFQGRTKVSRAELEVLGADGRSCTLHFQLWGCSQLSLLEKVNLQIGDSLGWRDLACRGHRFEVSGEAPWDDVLSGSQRERGAICQDIMNGKGV